jgi:hypothetical protein
MIDYEAAKEFESRLRKIVLYSADALPDRVAKYIQAVSENGIWSSKDQVLKTFVPLVDHLPAQFVEFALQELIEGREERDWASFHDMSELGIRGAMDYHPPAPIQGPFLRLLRTHEHEGLRLVHGLTNAATAYWAGRERDQRYLGYSRTALPIVLQLPSGAKELWGNEEVYCWFRHTTVGPYAVISALMALEFWMEEQLEGKRDGGELISTVLANSQSVAVLAICVAIALAYPGRCLPGVLPYVAHPLVWRMDIQRWKLDRQGTPVFDPLEHHEIINKQLRERNCRPQRRLDVRDLIAIALFNEEVATQRALKEAFSTFGDELHFQFREEKDQENVINSSRAEIEDYRGHLNRKNYQPIQIEKASGWRYKPPRQPTQEETDQYNKAVKYSEFLGLVLWANQTLESSAVSGNDETARVVDQARSFHRKDDFSKALDFDMGSDCIRQQAIAAVASAVASKAWPWAQEAGHADWCRLVLLKAAGSLRNSHDEMNRRNIYHLDPKLNAAKGLTALVGQGYSDAEIRLALLGLVLDPQLQVVEALFTGLRSAWSQEEILCWNCLGLAISLAVVPGDNIVPGMGLAFNETGLERLKVLWQQHLTNLEKGLKPQLPSIEVDDRGFFLWDLVIRVLWGLPVDELTKQPEAKAAILRLADDLLGWTISENLRGSDDDDRPRRHSEAPREWNHSFMGWLAHLSRFLAPDEAENHVFAPVLGTWPRLPDLTSDLLDGLLRYQVARLPLEPQAVKNWERVCYDLLGRPELTRRADEDYLSSDWSATVTSMIFVNHGMYVFKEEWPQGPAFSGVIDKWLDVVGTNYDAYRAFLITLKAASRHFPCGQVVGWLHRVTSRSSDIKALWRARDNGEGTARVLHRLWLASRPELMRDGQVFHQFSELVDRLATSGVTLASVIQQELEGLDAR